MIDLRPEFGAALVVGGGKVATRKVRALVEAQFRITVVAPEVDDEIRHAPWVTVRERPYVAEDLEGHALVFACTRSRELNREVGRAARKAGLPVVVADRQGESTFFSTAVLRNGDLAVAVSTSGAAPGLARIVRERIVAALGPGWGGVISAARAEREARLTGARRVEK
ncbi:MAG: precorrin-2 dehydrogenase/sirohydrochlorin ferrochelatase family protein [Tepidiformaceae bacterium]